MDFLGPAMMSYYSRGESSDVLSRVNEQLSASISSIEPEFLCLFHDMLTKEPCHYWNRDVYAQTYRRLSALCQGNPIEVYDELVERFLIGYGAYMQISDIINDLGQINDRPEIKNRMYRLPTYISIVEGCLTNLFRFTVLVLDQVSSKDYATQKKLQPLCDALECNGFELLVGDVDVDVRNAINHGGVMFRLDEGFEVIDFMYNKQGRTEIKSFKLWEFDDLIYRVYDTAGGVLLGICHFLNENFDSILVDRNSKRHLAFSLFSMELSIPTLRCRSINDVGDNKQLNLQFYVTNPNRYFLVRIAIEVAMIAFSRYNDYQQYMISFSGDRLQTSWMRFRNEQVEDMISRKRELAEVAEEVLRNDSLMWEPPTEEIDLQEIKYFRFPNYTGKNFKINRVADSSIDNRKRLRAHLYIGQIEEKSEILMILRDAISWLKTLKNPPSPTIPRKYGTMEADSLYINVYREDTRKNKNVHPENENFVCMVDYNVDGISTLKHGSITPTLWQQFHHETGGNALIAWREAKYVEKRKIGRNDPCYCGSGEKFKRCCMDATFEMLR